MDGLKECGFIGNHVANLFRYVTIEHAGPGHKFEPFVKLRCFNPEGGLTSLGMLIKCRLANCLNSISNADELLMLLNWIRTGIRRVAARIKGYVMAEILFLH